MNSAAFLCMIIQQQMNEFKALAYVFVNSVPDHCGPGIMNITISQDKSILITHTSYLIYYLGNFNMGILL